MVEDNILKLKIKRLRDTLYEKADGVLSQEKHKLKLETAMREREQEIQVHVDMLRAQMRQAEGEKSQISSELHERISKIDKLRKRSVLLQKIIENVYVFIITTLVLIVSVYFMVSIELYFFGRKVNFCVLFVPFLYMYAL